MKYILIGDPIGRDLANSKNKNDIQLSGLYQWANIFQKYGLKGTIKPCWRREDLEDYDIVHINYTPSNIQLPTVVKEELGDSSTKIVLNVDLDTSLWSRNWAPHITNMTNEIKMADIVFHVEPVGQRLVQQLIDSPVHLCPHPVDVNGLFDYIMPLEDRENMISTIFHRYTGETMTQYLAQKNIPLRRVMFGMHTDELKLAASQRMYDQLIVQQIFPDFITEISKSRMGCDLYDGFSFGRVPIEFAALGIPAVISNRIGSSWLFPNTTVDPYDIVGAHKIFTKLLYDDNFTNQAIKTAHDNCSYYSLRNSYDRFQEMLDLS
jgi:hypothetical protein